MKDKQEKTQDSGTADTDSQEHRRERNRGDEATMLREEAGIDLADGDRTTLREGMDATATSADTENTVPAEGDPERSLQVGSVVNNRFVIEKLLGRGGMGVVYRASDKRKVEAQDRDPHVAIKILGEDFRQHPRAFMALQRETRKSQNLAHPNIITVFDFDRDEDIVYMTMEELVGEGLDAYIARHPEGVPVKQALHIITSIAQALAYAHSRNIVHSDLKPGNVFITEENIVKVLDFGIARAVVSAAEGSGDQTVFNLDEISGLTPSYASLEMLHGEEPHTTDDIYALGLIAYELITGRHPYDRQPAHLALKKGLKPPPLRMLKRRQARAVGQAVALKREDRIQSIPAFLRAFEGISTPIKAVIATLTAGVLILTLVTIFRPPATGPDIPFSELDPALQSQITSELEDGRVALQYRDLNTALYHFNTAYELHPKNPDAVEGLDRVLEKIIPVLRQQEPAQALDQVTNLRKYTALSENEALRELKTELESQTNR